ncbi:ribosomal protein L7/L12 [Actinomadura sp. GC306]|uniref:ribosomal protein L7/L12 n=1 Tax=Actinomadura sp. GC306 TaxID=2530367 RepID=UPI0014054760|nr:ribosomal protein L7/L12 [Actinomadura sp. GC306]
MKKSAPYLLPEGRERVLEMIGKGHYIPAIKLVREITGLGLKEAKYYVDGLKGEAFARVVSPEAQGRARVLIAEGRPKEAVKLIRRELGLDSRAAKDYVRSLQGGLISTAPAGMLSDRVRAFKQAGDHESAIALVCAETGMRRDEALRFVEAIR